MYTKSLLAVFMVPIVGVAHAACPDGYTAYKGTVQDGYA